MPNRIPQSLDQPLLRDAIVEFRYTPLVQPDLLPGVFYERLRNDWQAPALSLSSINLGLQLTATSHPLPTFSKDGYRLQVLPGSINFNIENGYQGWTKSYLPLLEETCPKLLDEETVRLTQIGLRFVNLLPGADIFELANRFSPRPISSLTPTQQHVRWNLRDEATKVIVNLTSQVSLGKGEIGSVVDIDVNQQLQEEQDVLTSGLQLVQRFHETITSVFFGDLLPESYVANFGPHY